VREDARRAAGRASFRGRAGAGCENTKTGAAKAGHGASISGRARAENAPDARARTFL
jgi:hypothetical protein